MKISKQTAALLAEAIIFSHLQGARWASFEKWEPGSKYNAKDSEVLKCFFAEVKMFKEIYPNLNKLK